MKNLTNYLAKLPFIAILRGIQSHECLAVATVLYEADFRCIEVPLNSPNALQSIALLAQHLPDDCLIGAGTVISVEDVKAVQQVGGRLIVMPHSDAAVIRAAKELQMICTPGVATLSEAFAALQLGANGIKLFPAESVPPSALKAWRTVLPKETICLPVGGVKPDGLATYFDAGANGFGVGSNLYTAGQSVQQVSSNAYTYVKAWQALHLKK
ncbi:MAG: 2-dehydro-3-deoxy-6-phosphogalactonate aldolase [Pseudomonadota bacterium]